MTSFEAAFAAAKANVKGPTGTQRSSIFPELGGPGGSVPSWGYFTPADRELADAWRGRRRTETVDSMLNDSQVASLRQVVRLPAHTYIIELDPKDCPPAAAQKLADDLDIPLVGGDEHDDLADDFSARRHLDRALDALDYGHAVFEHAGRIDDDGWWRLVDLAPVPQWTIDDDGMSWQIDRHGHLLSVTQHGGFQQTPIVADHLVVFTWQGRPGDPRGRSMLRPLYFPYCMRDRTMRVMGMSAERTGMGIPVGSVPTGAVVGAKERMSALLGEVAAGHDTNLVLDGVDDVRKAIMLMGVTGSTPDLVGMLKYYDEAMARALLAMLVQLGQTQTGSRALGSTFDDLLILFRDAVIRWYCDTMNKQLVARWMARNPVEGSPRLVWRRREDAPPAAAPVVVDTPPAPVLPAAPLPVAARRSRLASRQTTMRASFAAVAGRELRRDPSEAELAAATDFGQLETQHVQARDDLAAILVRDRDELAEHAVDLVKAMATVDPLTLGAVLGPRLEVYAATMDTTAIVAMLTATAAQGVAQVIGEAARQGVALEASIDYEGRAAIEARELLRRLAVQVTEAVASAARTGITAAPLQASRGGLLSRLRPARMATVEADYVAAALLELTDSAPVAAAAGASMRAGNGGRFAAIATADTRAVHSSELLDAATCAPCFDVDGTEYASMDEALGDYPAGGFVACEGRERCRGTLVCIFADEQPSAR